MTLATRAGDRPADTHFPDDIHSVSRPSDAIDGLLADALRETRPDLLVVFGASAGLGQFVASSEAQRVIIVDRNVVHVRAAADALKGLDHVSVAVSDGTSHLDGELRAQAVAIRVPKEKRPGLQLIWDAFNLIEPGGKLYVAGAVRDGIKSYLHHTGELFGGVGTLSMRKGCRVGVAVRREGGAILPPAFDSELLDHQRFHVFPIEVRGKVYEVHSRPGVFSWDRFDAGTRALVETMEVRPADRVLDLGCGYGIVGVVAGELAPEGSVTMVDADIVAVEAARRTVAANGQRNAEVLLGDGTAGLEDDAFDVVAVNPPFHLDRKNDYRTAQHFVTGAVRVLRPGGWLFLVANRFLPYEEHVRAAFGDVTKAYEDKSYKILVAQKRAG